MSEITIRVSKESLDEALVALAMRRSEFRAKLDQKFVSPETRALYKEWADKAAAAYDELIEASVYSVPSPEPTEDRP